MSRLSGILVLLVALTLTSGCEDERATRAAQAQAAEAQRQLREAHQENRTMHTVGNFLVAALIIVGCGMAATSFGLFQATGRTDANKPS